MMTAVHTGERTGVVESIRVCSGACPFFEPLYDLGRKVAGTGMCGKHGGEVAARVGTACLWPKTEKPVFLSVVTAKRPRTAP